MRRDALLPVRLQLSTQAILARSISSEKSRTIAAALLTILFSIIIYGCLKLHKNRQFFKRKKINHLKPNFFLGNAIDMLLGRAHQREVIDRVYRAFPDDELVGHFEYFSPAYVVRSPELIERVFAKDFSHFHERTPVVGGVDRPDEAVLFVLGGNTWRAVRNKFSPLFTSGKLRYMYHSMADCGRTLVDVMGQQVGREVEISDLMSLFAMDVIGSTAFGLEPSVLGKPESQFRDRMKCVFRSSLWVQIKTVIKQFFPRVAKFFNINGFTDSTHNKYFFEIVSRTIAHRKETGQERNDFIQMLVQLKEKGKVEVQVHDTGDDYLMLDKIKNDTEEIKLTDNILIGGAFTFLMAGFHATAMTMAYALFEISQKPEVGEKIRREIKENIAGDVPTYEELRKMNYLENVIKETMRLHPTAPILSRTCTKNYVTPGGVEIRKGETVFLPLSSLHMDPAHWSEPESFDPDRFQLPLTPGTYLPFGDGPRICLAMRFAMMEMKFGLVQLLRHYQLELSEKTELPLQMDPRVFLDTPKGGITLRVSKLPQS